MPHKEHRQGLHEHGLLCRQAGGAATTLNIPNAEAARGHGEKAKCRCFLGEESSWSQVGGSWGGGSPFALVCMEDVGRNQKVWAIQSQEPWGKGISCTFPT